MAQRRLVKSPPELWAEVSSEAALARRLEQFGEIRITRVEPETTVAWEGERASGTVQLEAAGWGTKVTLTATPAPAAVAPPTQEPTLRLFARFLRRCPRSGDEAAAATADPGPPALGPEPPPPAPDPAPTSADPVAAERGGAPRPSARATAEVLADVLDALGGARHRPFSRE